MSFSFKNLLSSTLGALFGKAGKALKPAVSPLRDRLLVDAIRLAELPSPAVAEEPRAVVVLERLKSFGLLPLVNDAGDILLRLHSEQSADEAPILLFTDLGSKRWHPMDSLARLDAENAVGAGLSDSLGTAALLSIAERYQTGVFQCRRDLLLLFTAKSLDDPNISFGPILNSPQDRPFAAIGVRGFLLDRITHSIGSYRVKISVSCETGVNDIVAPNKVTETLIDTARTLLGITWDTEEKTKMFIRRLEALTVYGLSPQEGILELEIESSEAALLELAMNVVKATAGKIGEAAKLKTETTLLSFIPPGKPEKSMELFEILRKLTKEQRLKITEENGADPASFFTSEDIPALSMGIALGREGADRDIINIDSVEKGRLILERFIVEMGTRNGF
ncbi:hypothetical protein AGMMS50293_06770 [Spirochaetia bacterium]|nr:hypothetical protein AGMMS50293_06770 [Spirochaetia bacterium]